MRLKLGGIFVALAILLTGCPEPPSYPEYPIIEFDSFYAVGEEGYLTIAFTDGDGDIGLTSDMLESPFDTSSYYHYNMYMEYWEYNDALGQWEQGLNSFTLEPIVFTFRVPYLTPEGRNKALKGTIQVKIEPNYRDLNSVYSDSIKYRVKLIDRALHESEWVFTSPIWNGVVVD